MWRAMDVLASVRLTMAFITRQWARSVGGMAVVCGLLLFGMWMSQHIRLHFDEAYNLHLARTLAFTGVYGVQVNHTIEVFDPYVSTGPTIVAPLAIAMTLFGSDIQVVRVLLALGFVVCICVLLLGLRLCWGSSVARAFAAVAMTTPGAMFLGLSVLGEVWGSCLSLLGISILDSPATRGGWKSSLAAGLALGLAVVTKEVFALVLVVVLLIAATRLLINLARGCHSAKEGTAAAVLAVTVAFACMIGWRIFQLVTVSRLGAAEFGYWLDRSHSYAQSQISNVIVSWPLTNISAHLDQLMANHSLHVAAFLLCILMYIWGSQFRMPKGPHLLLFVGIGWMLWFLVMSGAGANARHLLPAILFLNLFTVLALSSIRTIRSVVSAVVIVACVLLVAAGSVRGVLRNVDYVHAAKRGIEDDLQAVEWVRQNVPEEVPLTGWGWYVPWSLGYLSGRSITRDASGVPPDIRFLVLTRELPKNPDGFPADPALRDLLRSREPAFHNSSYIIYKR
jgi:4-amino-4-deoxy-L-arabinose transferase-like glycosyltransferase